MNHEFLMSITANMPMKAIDVNASPYLHRHFAGYSESGGQWWYHRFLRADAERHLHTHPWTGRALVLCGRYTEQYKVISADPRAAAQVGRRYFNPGDFNQIYPSTLHRIIDVEPDTWTLLHIEPGRLPTWKFIADDGSDTIMQSSPEDWHTGFAPRQEEAA